MFWSDSELEELKGTAVVGLSATCYCRRILLRVYVDKIGRDDAEKDYNEKLAPAVKVRTFYEDL